MTYSIVNLLLVSSVFIRSAEAQYPYLQDQGRAPAQTVYDTQVHTRADNSVPQYDARLPMRGGRRLDEGKLPLRAGRRRLPLRAGRRRLVERLAAPCVGCAPSPSPSPYDGPHDPTKASQGKPCGNGAREMGEPHECDSGLVCTHTTIRGGWGQTCQEPGYGPPVDNPIWSGKLGSAPAPGGWPNDADEKACKAKGMCYTWRWSVKFIVKEYYCAPCNNGKLGAAPLLQERLAASGCVGCAPSPSPSPSPYDGPQDPTKATQGKPCGNGAREMGEPHECDHGLVCTHTTIRGGWGQTCQEPGYGLPVDNPIRSGKLGSAPAPGGWPNDADEKACKAKGMCYTWRWSVKYIWKEYYCAAC